MKLYVAFAYLFLTALAVFDLVSHMHSDTNVKPNLQGVPRGIEPHAGVAE